MDVATRRNGNGYHPPFGPTVVTEVHPAEGFLKLELPAVLIRAGFPSPAEEYIEGERLDLNEHLIRHPAATFVVRVRGDSMDGAGIHSGDYLIVDRSLEPADGKIVVAVVDGELTVKRLRLARGRAWLAAEHEDYPTIEIREGTELRIWGVVTSVIHLL